MVFFPQGGGNTEKGFGPENGREINQQSQTLDYAVEVDKGRRAGRQADVCR